MSSNVDFNDYHIQVEGAITDAVLAFLEEAAGEVESQAKRNCAVKTGKTKGSFGHQVVESEQTAYIGSNYENAIWEEFGTGIYALNGDGRKDVPWTYYDEATGRFYKTSGKPPKRMLWNAFNSLSGRIKTMAEDKLRGLS